MLAKRKNSQAELCLEEPGHPWGLLQELGAAEGACILQSLST